MLNVIYAACCK